MKKKRTDPSGFPGGSVVKNLPASVEDTCSIPGLGRSHTLCSNKKPVHNYWIFALSSALFPSAAATETHVSRICARQKEKPLP